jgi:hypothetical protein
VVAVGLWIVSSTRWSLRPGKCARDGSLISVTVWIVIVCGDLERKGEASGGEDLLRFHVQVLRQLELKDLS